MNYFLFNATLIACPNNLIFLRVGSFEELSILGLFTSRWTEGWHKDTNLHEDFLSHLHATSFQTLKWHFNVTLETYLM